MNNTDSNIYEVLEHYLAGTLPSGDKARLEERLRTDEALRRKMEAVRTSRNAIVQHKLKDLKSIMAEEQAKADNDSPFNKVWSIVIVAALIGSGSFYFIHQNRTAKETETRVARQEKKEVSAIQEEEASEETNSSPDLHAVKPSKKTAAGTEKTTEPSVTAEETQIENSTETAMTELPAENTAKNPVAVPHPPKDPSSIVMPEDLCKGVTISGELITEEPCHGSRNGSIEVSNLHGGKGPYSTSLNGEHSSSPLFKDLGQGSYRIEVTDKNGCKHQFNTLILKGKDCNLRYDFNPGQGQEWHGPVASQGGRLSILSKEGKTVFSREMKEGEQCSWNGYDLAGTLQHGYFVFVLEYKDGKVIKGSITITE